MLDLNDYRYFVRVVESGGLTAASRSFNIPKSTLGYRLKHLEETLGVRLLYRTSRSQSLTEAGTLFHRHAVDMLRHAELAESSIYERMQEPSGLIRYTSSVAMSQYALRLIVPKFLRDNPKVQLHQHIANTQVDIVGESYDLALRVNRGPLSDSNLVQRLLGSPSMAMFATPSYLAASAKLETPEDLADHDALLLGQGINTQPNWQLVGPNGETRTIPIQPRFSGNDIMMLKTNAQEGLGIVSLPAFVCRREVEDGTMKHVLPGWTTGQSDLRAVLPFRDGMLPSVRAFLDYLSAELPAVINWTPGN